MKQVDYSTLSEKEVTSLVEWATGWKNVDPDLEIWMVESVVVALLNHLRRKSKKEAEAAGRALGRIASGATVAFQNALLSHPEWFRADFLTSESVPVMFSARKRDQERARAIVKMTAVGEERNTETRGKQIHSAASRVAEVLYQAVFRRSRSLVAINARSGMEVAPSSLRQLEASGALLPNFSKDKQIQKLWWVQCHKELERLLGKNFEDHRVFRSYWKKLRGADQSESAKRTEVRKRIRKDLKQGLMALARGS